MATSHAASCGSEVQPANDATVDTCPSITVIIPCLDEEATVAKVVGDFRQALPSSRIIVVDNDSTDGTSSFARAAGATVVRESRRGKGFAVLRGFQMARDADLVLIVDGDDTYPAEAALTMIGEVERGAEMVIGTRLTIPQAGVMSSVHSLGNRLFVALVRLLFGVRTKDLLSGYRVFTRRFLDVAALVAQGFEIEAELSLQALAHGFQVAEVPIAYRARPVSSRSKLNAWRDGRRILIALIAFFRDYRPLTFFGLLGASLLLSSLLAGAPVVAEYIRTGLVLRLPLAVLAVGLAMLGAMALIGGIVLSSVNRRAAELASLITRR